MPRATLRPASRTDARPLRSPVKFAALRLLACTGLLWTGAGRAASAPTDPTFGPPAVAGTLNLPGSHEASGLAASRRAPDLLWTHNDSGGEPVLYAVGTDGKFRGSLRLRGARNEDWEDVASFTLDGTAWLLVGDVGDNGARRPYVELHLVAEPPPADLRPDRELIVTPAWTRRVRFPDGPRDCESVAVDPAERAIYLLSKRDNPPRLYRLPLPPGPEPVAIAEFAGRVPQVALLEQNDVPLLDLVARFTSLVTAMDFNADGTAAVVLTYGEPLLFLRRPGESWAIALAGKPTALGAHGLPQAEGACFSADGRSVYVVSERLPRLVRYDRR